MQVLYQLSYVGSLSSFPNHSEQLVPNQALERETGFEPATLSLEG